MNKTPMVFMRRTMTDGFSPDKPIATLFSLFSQRTIPDWLYSQDVIMARPLAIRPAALRPPTFVQSDSEKGEHEYGIYLVVSDSMAQKLRDKVQLVVGAGSEPSPIAGVNQEKFHFFSLDQAINIPDDMRGIKEITFGSIENPLTSDEIVALYKGAIIYDYETSQYLHIGSVAFGELRTGSMIELNISKKVMLPFTEKESQEIAAFRRSLVEGNADNMRKK